jgi:UPF0716 protein FxsA
VPLILLLIIVGVPIIELILLIEVGGQIGALYTVGLVIVTAAIGVTLVRLQGLSAMARAQASLDENKLPVGEAVDGVFLLIAGGMLLFPGFISDTIGLLLLIPIVRRGLGVAIWRGLAARGVVRWGSGEGVIDGEFEDVSDHPEPPQGDQSRLARPEPKPSGPKSSGPKSKEPKPKDPKPKGKPG